MEELDMLSKQDLISLYKFLNRFNHLPKPTRKAVIKKLKEKIDSK